MKDFVKFTENGEEKSGMVLISWLDGGSTKMKVLTEKGFSIISPAEITHITREAGKEMKEAIETAVDYVEKLVEKYKNAEVDNRIEEIKKAEQKSIERIKQELAELRNVEMILSILSINTPKHSVSIFQKNLNKQRCLKNLNWTKLKWLRKRRKKQSGRSKPKAKIWTGSVRTPSSQAIMKNGGMITTSNI